MEEKAKRPKTGAQLAAEARRKKEKALREHTQRVEKHRAQAEAYLKEAERLAKGGVTTLNYYPVQTAAQLATTHALLALEPKP